MRTRILPAGKNSQKQFAVEAHNGFTVLELLITISILTLSIGVAYNIIGSDNSARSLKPTAQRLVAALQQTRALTILNSAENKVLFNLDNREITFPYDIKPIKLGTNINIKISAADREVISSSRAAIGFFPNGSSTGGEITLAAKQGKYKITVNWLTGKVAKAVLHSK